jgi:hypothetical protein
MHACCVCVHFCVFTHTCVRLSDFTLDGLIMHVNVRICMYVHTYVCTHVNHGSVCTCVCVRIYIYACLSLVRTTSCDSGSMYTCSGIHTYIHACMDLYICMPVRPWSLAVVVCVMSGTVFE